MPSVLPPTLPCHLLTLPASGDIHGEGTFFLLARPSSCRSPSRHDALGFHRSYVVVAATARSSDETLVCPWRPPSSVPPRMSSCAPSKTSFFRGELRPWRPHPDCLATSTAARTLTLSSRRHHRLADLPPLKPFSSKPTRAGEGGREREGAGSHRREYGLLL